MPLRLRTTAHLQQLSPQDLVIPELFEELVEFIRGTYYSHEPDAIAPVHQVLQDALALVDAEKGTSWPRREQYIQLLALLKFGLLVQLSLGEIKQLVKDNVAYFSYEEPDLRGMFLQVIFALGDYDGSLRRVFFEALTTSEARLRGIAVRHIIEDYNRTISSQRGDMSRLSYLNSKNDIVRSMSADNDKEALMNLLQAYDWLSSGAPLPQELIEPERRVSQVIPTTHKIRTAPLAVSAVRTTPQPIASPSLPIATPIRVVSAAPRAYVPTATVAKVVPEPSVLKSSGPAFLFDLADEREADKFRAQSLTESDKKTLEQQLRGLASELITKYNFSFKDDSHHRRFVNLLVSRLKDVRTVVDVREVLLKPLEGGGLGMPSDKAEQVIKIFEGAKKDFASRIKVAAPEAAKPAKPLDKLMEADITRFLLKPDAGSKVGVLTPKVTIEQATIVVPPLVPEPAPEVSVPTGPQPIVPRPPQPAAPTMPAVPRPTQAPGGFSPDKIQAWREEMLKEIARVAPPVPAPPMAAREQAPGSKESKPSGATSNLPPISSPIPPSAVGLRPQLTDIKAASRTMGPVGELRSLGLTDFRRLGPVLSALDKVQAKIDLIGEASITKRLESVRAWQSSPVYQRYLQLGRESIEQGKAVADVIAELDSRGEETLSEAEFNAIADFNAKIRF